jgi:hypothetical protein
MATRTPAAPAEPRESASARLLDAGTLLLLPGLTIYLGFNAGGYFAGTTGWAAAALAIVLGLRLSISGPSLRAPSLPLALAAGALALFAGWTLLSGGWSGNYGRSLIEFDRALLYLLVLLVFGSIEAPRPAFRFLPIGFALAAVILGGAGLVTRTLPDLWPFAQPADEGRLAYPVTYSNGLGILASLGIIAGLHVASWGRERALVRIPAAAALPLLAATLMLTFSRGAILACAVGILVYAVLGRPRGLLTVALGTLPFVVLAAYAAYDAELLASEHATSPAAQDQGREVAVMVGIAMLGGAASLRLLLPLERRLRRARLPKISPLLAAGLAGLLAIGVSFVAVTQAPDGLGSLGEEILRDGASREGGLTRERLTDPSDIADVSRLSRVQYWRVALDAFEDEPVRGTGVGTFAKRWAKDRPTSESTTEGHSIYLETLGELGLVGASLIVVVLALLVMPFVASLRRGQRPLQAAALAIASAWLVHAGIDWDWELPALTVWLFAFGGCALAASPTRLGVGLPSTLMRVIAASACVLIAVTPATIAVSQSRLDSSVAALLRGDCRTAQALATEASSLLPPRAEPYEILAYCQSRSGQHLSAIAMMKRAIERDPHNWELLYGSALVRAAAGEDPRSALRTALLLNPREALIRVALDRFGRADPQQWREQARNALLPLP